MSRVTHQLYIGHYEYPSVKPILRLASSTPFFVPHQLGPLASFPQRFYGNTLKLARALSCLRNVSPCVEFIHVYMYIYTEKRKSFVQKAPSISHGRARDPISSLPPLAFSGDTVPMHIFSLSLACPLVDCSSLKPKRISTL